jgi:EAL domain-containing protein (putative c-di-GMP-specific phosphodiesterase class I)
MLKINDDDAIVRTIVEMGKNLGVNVVAEGVEDEETWNALGTLGCDTCQGYFFSKPVPPDELVTWLDTAPWPVRPRTKMIDDGLLRADGTTG